MAGISWDGRGRCPRTPGFKTPFGENSGVVSPDGKWLAYASDESGREEIYAMPFPHGGSRVQISIEGGTDAFWSPLGDELFFKQPSGHMVGTIDTERTTATDLVVGRPRPLFEGEGREGLYNETTLSPTQDGGQFLITHYPKGSELKELVHDIRENIKDG